MNKLQPSTLEDQPTTFPNQGVRRSTCQINALIKRGKVDRQIPYKFTGVSNRHAEGLCKTLDETNTFFHPCIMPRVESN